MPETPPRPNGFDLQVPMLGRLQVTGRDVLVLVMLSLIGVGIIAIQIATFRSFEREFTGQMTTLGVHVQKAQSDRDQLLALLRLRICIDLAERPHTAPQLEGIWRKACA